MRFWKRIARHRESNAIPVTGSINGFGRSCRINRLGNPAFADTWDSENARWDLLSTKRLFLRPTLGVKRLRSIGTKRAPIWEGNGKRCRCSACEAWPAGEPFIGLILEPHSKPFWK